MVDETDKVIISISVLVGAAIIAGIVAKIVDICYDRASISDDASDVSEHTRNLIRARLTVMKFRNQKGEKSAKTPIETEEQKKENAVKLLRVWSAKSRVRAHPQLESAKRVEETMKVEDIAGSSSDDTKNKDKETEIPPQNTESVIVVDETVKPEVKRPKSALKKPKPVGATTTDTSGNTSLPGTEGARPKSSVKRVTIAVPENKRSESLQTVAEQSSRESKSVSPASMSGISLQSNSGSSVNKLAEKQDISSVESEESKGSSAEQADVVEAWNEDVEGATSSENATERVTSPATTAPSGKSDWSKTYVLYRGNSDDLFVPFKTKRKSKAKSEAKRVKKNVKKKDKNAKQ